MLIVRRLFCAVSVVLAKTPDCDAVIVVLPAAVAVASPAVLIVATELFDEPHAT